MPLLMVLLAFQACLSAPIQEAAEAVELGVCPVCFAPGKIRYRKTKLDLFFSFASTGEEGVAELFDTEALLEEAAASYSSGDSFSSGGAKGGSFVSGVTQGPPGAKFPYDAHLKANKASWAAVGGFSAAQDKQIPVAKTALDEAKKGVVAAEKTKEYSELGCPCEGA